MKAWMLEKGRKRPTLVDRPTPEPGPGQVRIRTAAVAINPVDLETAAGGNAMLLPLKRPFVPGVDLAGVVDAVGEGVDDLAPGAAVFAYCGVPFQGAFAEQVVLPRATVAAAPAEHAMPALAALPLPALCALQAYDEIDPPAGGTALVHGGAGGVGSVAVQIFAAAGLRVVATASAADTDFVRGLGAAEVIDYRTTRFEDAVADVDLVFDTVGGETLERSFAVVRAGGAVTTLTAVPEPAVLRAAGFSVPTVVSWFLPLAGRGLRKRARRADARFLPQVTVPSGRRLDAARSIGHDRRFQVRIDRTFDFDALPAALDHAAHGKPRGRVVLSTGDRAFDAHP